MAFFGLKLGLDLEIWASHHHQKLQRVPPPGDELRARRAHVQARMPDQGTYLDLFFQQNHLDSIVLLNNQNFLRSRDQSQGISTEVTFLIRIQFYYFTFHLLLKFYVNKQIGSQLITRACGRVNPSGEMINSMTIHY